MASLFAYMRDLPAWPADELQRFCQAVIQAADNAKSRAAAIELLTMLHDRRFPTGDKRRATVTQAARAGARAAIRFGAAVWRTSGALLAAGHFRHTRSPGRPAGGRGTSHRRFPGLPAGGRRLRRSAARPRPQGGLEAVRGLPAARAAVPRRGPGPGDRKASASICTARTAITPPAAWTAWRSTSTATRRTRWRRSPSAASW